MADPGNGSANSMAFYWTLGSSFVFVGAGSGNGTSPSSAFARVMSFIAANSRWLHGANGIA